MKDRFESTKKYIASRELLDGVNVAIALQKPLLIKGEPGTGKTMLAEAVAKALGTGFRGFGPKDIEALRDELGKPYVKLYGGAERRAAQMGIQDIQVSISNIKDYALAFAVAQGEGRKNSEVFADGETGQDG